MMAVRVMVGLLLLAPLLAGCTEEGGILGGVFAAADPDLDGLCGHVYRQSWDKQVFVDVSLDQRARLEGGDVRDLEVTATWYEDEPIRSYAKGTPDQDGCLGFRLKGEGGYIFWAFGPLADDDCFLSGYTDGSYDGETPIVAVHVTVTRQC